MSRASARGPGLYHLRSPQQRGPRVPSKLCSAALARVTSSSASMRYGPLARGPSGRVTKHHSHGRHEPHRGPLARRNAAESPAAAGVRCSTSINSGHVRHIRDSARRPARKRANDLPLSSPMAHAASFDAKLRRHGRPALLRRVLVIKAGPAGGGADVTRVAATTARRRSSSGVGRCRRRSFRRARGRRARRRRRLRAACR